MNEHDASNDQQEIGRPSEHGGGEAGPPIAGYPDSFPQDAELARTLLWRQDRATLSTLTAEGFPYGSAVSYAVDEAGAPIILISEMAEHTVNARGDSRVSMLVAAKANSSTDPLSVARCTVVGNLRIVTDAASVRKRYLDRHPYAAHYVDFTDFRFWQLDISQCRFVGGFGHMSWVTEDAYKQAMVDPVAEAADAIIEHMNDDHADANLAYVKALAGITDATNAAMVGVDRYGVTLQATVESGSRMARLSFPEPLRGPDEARPAVIDLLVRARAAAEGS